MMLQTFWDHKTITLGYLDELTSFPEKHQVSGLSLLFLFKRAQIMPFKNNIEYFSNNKCITYLFWKVQKSTIYFFSYSTKLRSYTQVFLKSLFGLLTSSTCTNNSVYFSLKKIHGISTF